MRKTKNNNIYNIISRIFFIILGTILTAIGLEIFLIPNSMFDGGIVGISIMASYISKLPLGLFTFLLNIPFFIIGYKHIGKMFTITTLFSVVSLSLELSLFSKIPIITNDILLASVFGGIILGLGVGMIIRNGGSLDGTEIIAIIFDKKSSFSVGQIVMFFNLFILSMGGFIFGWEKAMYSLIAYFIAFKIIDFVIEGFDESKSVIIISNKYKEISECINSDLGRGTTILNGQGGYSGNETNVIYVVISRLEITKLKEIINSIDDEALMTIGNVEISGKKFLKQKR